MTITHPGASGRGRSSCLGRARRSKLSFIHLRSSHQNRIHEAFEQCTRHLYHVGLLE